MNVREKLESGFYESKMERKKRPDQVSIGKYPTAEYAREYATKKEQYDLDMVAYRVASQAQSTDNARLYQQFKQEVLEETFGEDLLWWPTLIEKLYLNVEGESCDMTYIFNRMGDLVDIVQAAKFDAQCHVATAATG